MKAVSILALAILTTPVSCRAAPPRRASQQSAHVIRLWPSAPPATADWTGPEESADAELPNLGKVHIITNVTVPELTIVRPPAGKSNGTAMVVVPGGAFRALPWDLDGLETARWLTQHGITAAILKYRVRPPKPGTAQDRSFDDFARRTEGARQVAVGDAEQAMRLLRSRATELHIASDRIGMIGFSAGAMVTAIAADSPDAAVRPNFAAALYGAWLKETAPSASAAPLFIVAAQDDNEAPPTRSADLFKRWTAANRPAELHVYAKGGHGFAFRKHKVPADGWPTAFEAWLKSSGYLPSPKR